MTVYKLAANELHRLPEMFKLLKSPDDVIELPAGTMPGGFNRFRVATGEGTIRYDGNTGTVTLSFNPWPAPIAVLPTVSLRPIGNGKMWGNHEPWEKRGKR